MELSRKLEGGEQGNIIEQRDQGITSVKRKQIGRVSEIRVARKQSRESEGGGTGTEYCWSAVPTAQEGDVDRNKTDIQYN